LVITVSEQENATTYMNIGTFTYMHIYIYIFFINILI
jgi:hypothetical protein